MRTRSPGLSWTAPKAAATSTAAARAATRTMNTRPVCGRDRLRPPTSDACAPEAQASRWESVRVEPHSQRFETLHHTRTEGRVVLRRHGVNRAVLDSRGRVPARTRRDHLGCLRIERQVCIGQDHDFWIPLDDALGAHLPYIA